MLALVSPTYPPDMELNGTTAIVSGGASGLGEATARELAKAGALVVVADLSEERGRTVAHDIGGRFARTDVSDEASVADAVAVAAGTGHPLRVAVSCAGIAWAARTVGRDGTPHDLGAYQKVIAVNLIGTFNLMRLSAAAMAATERPTRTASGALSSTPRRSRVSRARLVRSPTRRPRAASSG